LLYLIRYNFLPLESDPERMSAQSGTKMLDFRHRTCLTDGDFKSFAIKIDSSVSVARIYSELSVSLKSSGRTF